MYVVNKSKIHKLLENLSKITEISLLKKGHLPLILSPETDRILFRNPLNNIPKIILMIDDPVKDIPCSLETTIQSFVWYIYAPTNPFTPSTLDKGDEVCGLF